MIREFKDKDLIEIMQIWFDTNIKAHDFIQKEYWTENFEMVKSVLPQAELYVYEDDAKNQIDGFVGLSDNYIEGIFVREDFQSKGIGKQLLDYAKGIKNNLSLSVYQKNTRAIRFYQREGFIVQSENIDEDTNQKEYVMVWENKSTIS